MEVVDSQMLSSNQIMDDNTVVKILIGTGQTTRVHLPIFKWSPGSSVGEALDL